MIPIVDTMGRTIEVDVAEGAVVLLVDGQPVAHLTPKGASDLGAQLSHCAARSAAAEVGSLTLGEVGQALWKAWNRRRRA